MSRIICIDYGQKRCGLAVTDPLRIIVSPLEAIATKDLFDYLMQYLEAEFVEELVIGYPVHKDGTKTYLCAEIDEFLLKVAKQFPILRVFKVDESFSSQEASKLLAEAIGKKKKRQEKGKLDMYSAVVILRRFLGH